MTLEEKGFHRTLRKQGRSLKVISGTDAGTGFRATINRIGAYALSTDLGEDPRGKRIMELAAQGAPDLAKLAQVQDVKSKEKFVVVEIGLDSAVYSKKYALSEWTSQDS